jgi:murein DD-endopeptidase MepM/ murein hydrolase activator NlpD
MPNPIKNRQEPSAAEHGIGGGVLYEETVETYLSPDYDEQVLESVALDTESFLKSRILFYDSHTVKSGDHISVLAVNYGLNQDTIISINKITNSRLLQIGKVLKIPNQDGILHTVKNGETLSKIAERYKADIKSIQTINELFSEDIIAGKDLFIPGVKLDWISLQEINGDLFIWPVSGAITSPYGYRRDPFNSGRNQFHTGIDIRGNMGTPIKAAMAGRVSQVGTDNVLGNYVIISHHSGYRTLYGHMSVIRTRTGAYVTQGELIGNVGSTGLSTGPHLHFTVYKNGVTVNPRTLMR